MFAGKKSQGKTATDPMVVHDPRATSDNQSENDDLGDYEEVENSCHLYCKY